MYKTESMSTNTRHEDDCKNSYMNIRLIPFEHTLRDIAESSQSSLSDNMVYFEKKETILRGYEYHCKNEITVFDVASYILKVLDKCSTMKLHKLLYYSQAWNIVWSEEPLFKEAIEAWANGPVIRELFNFHKGLFEISFWNMTIGNWGKLSSEQKLNIEEVLRFYGGKSAQWLIDQTHFEDPWKNARKGLSSFERGCNVIQLDDIYNYYSSLRDE